MSHVILCFWRKFFVNSLTMSSKKVNEESQATKKMVTITMEVKKEIVEKYEGGCCIPYAENDGIYDCEKQRRH
jgi:hypothetical protein